MPTKLNQDQIDGLNEELRSLDSIDESLETKISIEDSMNDSVDVLLTSSISGKQDILISGTNIKTINGNSLLGSGNISTTGSNPFTQIGYGVGSVITNTTSITISASLLIPAGTLATNQFLMVRSKSIKTAGTGTSYLRMSINTTNSLVGSTQIGIAAAQTTTSSYIQSFWRDIYFDGTYLQCYNPSNAISSDITSGSIQAVTFNKNVDNYLIFSVGNTTLADSMSIKKYSVFKYD